MKIFVSVPSKGSVTVEFMACIIRMLSSDGIDVELSIHRGGSELPRVRNQETLKFLQGTCDKFLTIDDDVVYTPENVQRISSHGALIVGGFYYLKDRVLRKYVCETNGNSLLDPDERGLVALRYIGTGFLCIGREVFSGMMECYPDDWYYPEGNEIKHYDFWPVGIDRKQRRWLGEDWWFCQRAHDMGLTVWGDTKVVLGHVGQIVYPV